MLLQIHQTTSEAAKNLCWACSGTTRHHAILDNRQSLNKWSMDCSELPHHEHSGELIINLFHRNKAVGSALCIHVHKVKDALGGPLKFQIYRHGVWMLCCTWLWSCCRKDLTEKSLDAIAFHMGTSSLLELPSKGSSWGPLEFEYVRVVPVV